MKKFLRKNKKYIGLVLIAAIVFNFAFLSLTAKAAEKAADVSWVGQVIGWISGGSLLFISSSISMVLGAVFGVVLWLEAQIIDYIISPANFSFTNSPIVTLGWGIARDLANMFFILILLIIAFATVLKIQSYAIKQLWWKVLVAAILINFSLVIAGFVIDFTQVLTAFFLKQITGDGSLGTITTRLASSMQILNFYNPAKPESIGQGVAQFGASGIAAVVGIILTLIGLVITVFVFGAAAMFLIVRILHIWFLLIFAPFVWMLWILPSTSKYFSQWWDDFIKWTFFAPAYVFMIYLSLSIFDINGKFKTGVFSAGDSEWMKAAPGLTTVGMPQAIFQWILVIAMMFGSLIVAQKLGVEGATGARKILTGWGTGTKNWAGRQLRRQALGIGAKEAAPGVEARPGLLVRGAQKLAGTKIPGRRLLAGQVFKMTAGEAGTVEEAQKQFDKWTPEAKEAFLKKSPGFITNALFRNQQMAAALSLKKDGKLDKVGEARIKELAALASQQYPKQLDEILKVAPHLAKVFNKDTKAVVAKIDKIDEIMDESLSYPDVIMNISPEQFKTMARKGSDKKMNILKGVINAEYEKLRASLQNSFESNNDESAFNALLKIDEVLGFKGEKPPSKEARNKALGELSKEHGEEMEKLVRAKFSTSSPAWDIG